MSQLQNPQNSVSNFPFEEKFWGKWNVQMQFARPITGVFPAGKSKAELRHGLGWERVGERVTVKSSPSPLSPPAKGGGHLFAFLSIFQANWPIRSLFEIKAKPDNELGPVDKERYLPPFFIGPAIDPPPRNVIIRCSRIFIFLAWPDFLRCEGKSPDDYPSSCR